MTDETNLIDRRAKEAREARELAPCASFSARSQGRAHAEPEDELRSFRDAHIHGAVHAQIREVFAGTPTATTGNLPLPGIAALERQLLDWGVNRDTEIIVYGPSLALAARGWWVLKWAGLEQVRVLDGGLKAWTALGGPLAQGDTVRARAPDTAALGLSAGHLPTVSVEEVERLPASTLLIDARDEASYRAGRIPGAINLPSSQQWTPGAALRTVDEIRAIYDAAGAFAAHDVVAYCGGGVLSALTILNLTALGAKPRLFVGSWSEWIRSPRRMALSANEKVTT